MQSRYEELTLDTQGDGDMLDVTAYAQKAIDNAGFADGLCTVFVAHSTCGMTTIEHEPGCNADLNSVLESVAPQARDWEHNARNADTCEAFNAAGSSLFALKYVLGVQGRLKLRSSVESNQRAGLTHLFSCTSARRFLRECPAASPFLSIR